MNPLAAIFDHPLLREVPWRSLGVPLLIFMVLAMMIIPLPPFLLDLCFTFNIALALVVMMAAAYTRRPLDFARKVHLQAFRRQGAWPHESLPRCTGKTFVASSLVLLRPPLFNGAFSRRGAPAQP